MPKDYTFDPETGDFVATRDFNSGNPSAPSSNSFTIIDRLTDNGGTNLGLQPPGNFFVDSFTGQDIRVSPDGKVTVDVTIVVEDGLDSAEYEVRVTK